MKRKLLALALSMTMIFGLTGCKGGGSASVPDSGSMKVSGETEQVELNGITYNKAKDLTK